MTHARCHAQAEPMTMSGPLHPAEALMRFGLGARPGDLDESASDVRGNLIAEVRRRAEINPVGSHLRTSSDILVELREESRRVEFARATLAGDDERIRPEGSILARAYDRAEAAGKALPSKLQPKTTIPRQCYEDEVLARVDLALHADTGLTERLVSFWANHFAVSISKGNQVHATAGAFEREAIRPFIYGKFSDMLFAVETHPTMIYYLDNQQSVGPNSGYGLRAKKGLNENLAREILELHTLGVSGGYSQEDVTNLARVITGWTVVGPEGKLGRPGTAAFNAGLHEPGEQRVLEVYYPDYGPDQARDVLRALSEHPATARHLAFKFARHFVADEPPESLVEKLSKVYLDGGGDLASFTMTLLESDEAWMAGVSKIRSPQEFVLSAFRLIQRPPEGAAGVTTLLDALGQKLWDPPGPNGYPDTFAHWATPEGLKTRLSVAVRLAQRASDQDPLRLLEAAFGSASSRETRQAVSRAESRAQGIALLLMSPEFQRR